MTDPQPSLDLREITFNILSSQGLNPKNHEQLAKKIEEVLQKLSDEKDLEKQVALAMQEIRIRQSSLEEAYKAIQETDPLEVICDWEVSEEVASAVRLSDLEIIRKLIEIEK